MSEPEMSWRFCMEQIFCKTLFLKKAQKVYNLFIDFNIEFLKYYFHDFSFHNYQTSHQTKTANQKRIQNPAKH